MKINFKIEINNNGIGLVKQKENNIIINKSLEIISYKLENTELECLKFFKTFKHIKNIITYSENNKTKNEVLKNIIFDK